MGNVKNESMVNVAFDVFVVLGVELCVKEFCVVLVGVKEFDFELVVELGVVLGAFCVLDFELCLLTSLFGSIVSSPVFFNGISSFFFLIIIIIVVTIIIITMHMIKINTPEFILLKKIR